MTCKAAPRWASSRRGCAAASPSASRRREATIWTEQARPRGHALVDRGRGAHGAGAYLAQGGEVERLGNAGQSAKGLREQRGIIVSRGQHDRDLAADEFGQ